MGSSSFFLVSGFSLLILAGVLVSDHRTSTEQPFGLGSLPVHITALLLASFALTLAGSVGIGAALTPIKAQAGDRVHEVLTHRPGFVNFNHRILPDAS
mmetsp:Transcript_3794/g.8678  ORF Transcript_3794/g.8678 Transcript_3794/m.8678 type:complete len:98 (+) Transcript_3794:143-436(+)